MGAAPVTRCFGGIKAEERLKRAGNAALRICKEEERAPYSVAFPHFPTLAVGRDGAGGDFKDPPQGNLGWGVIIAGSPSRIEV